MPCVYVDHLAYGGTIHSFMLYAGALPTGMEAAASVGACIAGAVANATKFALK